MTVGRADFIADNLKSSFCGTGHSSLNVFNRKILPFVVAFCQGCKKFFAWDKS